MCNLLLEQSDYAASNQPEPDPDNRPLTFDDYKECYKAAAFPCEKPLQWWKTRREEYPVLSKMALDLLSIPLMSVECERVFSSAKILLTDSRNGLKEAIIEACTLIRHWLREADLT